MLVLKVIPNYGSCMFCKIIESYSEKTSSSFILCTNMAAMKSGENHLYEGLLTFGNLYIA